MSKNLIDVGDSVVFAQRYLPNEPKAELYNRQGIVRRITDDGFAFVEFQYQPGKLHKVEITDLEPLPTDPDDIVSLDECESLDCVEEGENHEFGGMSNAQLIAHKLYAQEHDPALDRSLSKLIH